MARLQGYQYPPRGGRGRCRRICKRTPSGAAAAAPPAGALLRLAKSGNVWVPSCGLLPNETHVASAVHVLQRETGLPLLTDDSHLVRNEAKVTFSDNTKHHVSICMSHGPSQFIASHVRTYDKIEAAVENVSTQLEDSDVVHASVTIDGQALTPT
jgi:hypothetical protein